MTRNALGVDVGGTFAKLALISPNGEVLRASRLPTQPNLPPSDFAKALCAAVDGWRFSSVGLALAGGVDARTGRLMFAPNLPRWVGFSFSRELAKRLGVRVVAENDANAAVWGGYVRVLRRRPKSVLGVTLGTGVGGGVVIDGRLVSGATCAAGELGHQVLRVDGYPCACGRRGCLEAYVGTAAILRAARRHMLRTPTPLTPAAITAAANKGDAGARRVWEETGRWLGEGLANAVLLLNPEAVIVLGGVARAGNLILDPIRRVFRAQPFREAFSKLALVAPGDRDWGCVGAALLSMENR